MQQFGSGELFGKALPTTANPNPTPRRFAVLQDVSFDESFDGKPLYGSLVAALRMGRGKYKGQIKAKSANIDGHAYNEIFFPGSVTTGGSNMALNEVAQIPLTTSYTYTAANAGTAGAAFVEDHGVTYADGTPLSLVTTSPTQGQYSQTAGTYTFAAADAGAFIVVNYSFTVTAGYTVTVKNTLMGEAPYFEVRLAQPLDGGMNKYFPRCSANKLNMATKQDDWMIPEMDIDVLQSASGIIHTDYYAK